MLDFHWTPLPPTAPGEYWWRGGDNDHPVRLQITETMLESLPVVGEWWRPIISFTPEQPATTSLMSLRNSASFSTAHA